MSETSERKQREAAIRQIARDEYEVVGEVEVDDNATISEGTDNGAFVQAWVWVSFCNTPFDKEAGTA